VYINPMSRSRVGRIAWLWFRHPVKSREFPAKHERLVTAEELLRFPEFSISSEEQAPSRFPPASSSQEAGTS